MLPASAEPSNSPPSLVIPSAWLFIITGSLLAGQAIAPYKIPTSGLWLVVFVWLVLCAWSGRRYAVLLLVSGLVFAVGYARHRQLLFPQFGSDHIRSMMKHESRLYIEGMLSEEPEKLPDRNRWSLHSERIWYPTGAWEATGHIIVSIRHAAREWHYGDRVRAILHPRIPRDSGNPGGFNYATYLLRHDVHATAFLDSDGTVERLGNAAGVVRGAIEKLRRRIRDYFEHHFSPESGALMKALVVGDMGQISKGMRADFTAAGVTHLLSISGLHVAMLGLVVFWAVRWGCSFCPYLLLRWNLVKWATVCSFFAVAFYTALAGARVPTVRSAIMIGVYELAVLLDREDELLVSLTFAALLIGIVWPAVIADISFQLSFVAVFFIAWGMRQIRERFPARPKARLVQEQSWLKPKVRQIGFYLAVPILGTLGTGPLVAHYFGHLSLAGLLSNPVIVPLVGFVVVPLGLLIGFLSLLLPQAALTLVWLAKWPVAATMWLVTAFSRLPLANIGVPAPNLLEVAVLYLLIWSLLFAGKNRMIHLAAGFAILLLVADAGFWWHERWMRRELRVTHLNVGNGDAAVVELPGSKVLIIDAGGAVAGDFDTGESIIAPFLRARKIITVDYLFVSHPRVDHYGGMRSLLKEFAASEFWSSALRGRGPRFHDLEEGLKRAKIKRIILQDGDPCRFIDRVKMCVLYAPHDGAGETSVVLSLEFGKARFLFTGDIDKGDERFLRTKAGDLRSAVIKVPRHGSAGASTAAFIATVHPRAAVFSMAVPKSGERRRDEVVERYRKAGAKIFRTDEDGAIIFETDGRTIRYHGYKSGRRGKIEL